MAVDRNAEQLRLQARAANTHRAYQADWRRFVAWCGYPAAAATPDPALACVRLGHVTETSKGLEIILPTSKTDQEARTTRSRCPCGPTRRTCARWRLASKALTSSALATPAGRSTTAHQAIHW